MLKSKLEKVKAALEATSAESMASMASIAELENDKKKMRQNTTASRRRISDQYADHADLQALAEAIENLPSNPNKVGAILMSLCKSLPY